MQDIFEEITAEYPDLQIETDTRINDSDEEEYITTIRLACIVNNKVFSKTHKAIGAYMQSSKEDRKVIRTLKRGIVESVDAYLSVVN